MKNITKQKERHPDKILMDEIQELMKPGAQKVPKKKVPMPEPKKAESKSGPKVGTKQGVRTKTAEEVSSFKKNNPDLKPRHNELLNKKSKLVEKHGEDLKGMPKNSKGISISKEITEEVKLPKAELPKWFSTPAKKGMGMAGKAAITGGAAMADMMLDPSEIAEDEPTEEYPGDIAPDLVRKTKPSVQSMVPAGIATEYPKEVKNKGVEFPMKHKMDDSQFEEAVVNEAKKFSPQEEVVNVKLRKLPNGTIELESDGALGEGEISAILKAYK